MHHNMMNAEGTHRLGINAFSDYTETEYKQLLGYNPTLKTTYNY